MRVVAGGRNRAYCVFGRSAELSRRSGRQTHGNDQPRADEDEKRCGSEPDDDDVPRLQRRLDGKLLGSRVSSTLQVRRGRSRLTRVRKTTATNEAMDDNAIAIDAARAGK